MRFTEQSRRLLPGAEEKLSANAYLGLTALTGLIGWIPTVYLIHFQTPPPSGTVGLADVGLWIQAATQHTWTLMGLWAVLSVGLIAIGVLRVERGAFLSVPQLLWTAGIVISLGVNAVGVWLLSAPDAAAWQPVLVWGPWFALYTVAYLVTGLLVQRGGIYLGAGVVSLLLTAYSLYAHVTTAGALVIDPSAQVPLAGAVLLPIPYTYLVLALLHVVPVTVDAARGGRQLTDAGIPEVKAESLENDDGSGGIVPE